MVILSQEKQDLIWRREMSGGVMTLLSLFAVRVMLPLVVTLGLGMLLSRWDARRVDA